MSTFIIEIMLFLPLFLIFLHRWINWRMKTTLLTDWPILGMMPSLLRNAHRVHDFATDIMKQSDGTFEFKGPSLANMDLLITSDPANIHYMLSKNFWNYPKGPEFRKIFDILGDGIFNADFEVWELHRRTTVSLFNHVNFIGLLQKTVRNKLENGLIPFLDFASNKGVVVDLQEVFQRLTFDGICLMLLEHDPCSLSIDLPYIRCEKAFTLTEEALLYRHIVPESVWRLQSWIGIGKEKSLSQAWDAFDQFINECLTTKHDSNGSDHVEGAGEEEFSLLTAYTKSYKDKTGNPKKFLRDTMLNLMIAGRDTTSTALTWFFWLLSKNPLVETKIRDEIKAILLSLNEVEKWRFFSNEELRKMVYLHGALCEALRLYPPVSLEHKAPVEADVLPSGHRVDKHVKIILSFYSMGRMESIWGKDCLEFNPERWITDKGGIKHEPSYKFPAFNAGPRTCIGKEMAFAHMKMVVSTIIYHYKVEVVEGQCIVPSDSIILQMKYGLKARLVRRGV